MTRAATLAHPLALAIEIFDITPDPEHGAAATRMRIDINGFVWAYVDAPELAAKLAAIGSAYADGDMAQLLRTSEHHTG